MKPKLPKWTPLAYRFETKQHVKKRVLRRAQIEWFRCRMERAIFMDMVYRPVISYEKSCGEAPERILETVKLICDEAVTAGVLRPNWGEDFLVEVTGV
jgi:hypothetical protein